MSHPAAALARQLVGALPAPTFLDRVVGYISPAAGVRRLQARAMYALAGGYEGARSDRRELRTMTRRAAGVDSDTLPDLPALRGRSRELLRNAPIASGALKTKVTSIVGWGLDPQPRIDREYLGVSESDARAFQRQAKRLWWHWAWSLGSDWEGRLPFRSMVRLATHSRFASGDVLVIRQWRDPRPGELFGTRAQLIEADRLCNPNGTPDTDRLAAGVELDPTGAPVAYWICDRHPDDHLLSGKIPTWTRVPAWGAVSGERRVLHLFAPDRPHATRGVPDLAAVIAPLRGLKTYTDSELMASVVSSFFTVLIKHAAGDNAGLGIAEASGTPRSDQSPAKAAGELQLGPGAILDLMDGEEAQFANPMRPNAAFDPFVNAILQQIGAHLEIPYELLVKRFTASYSASMAALQEAWRMFLTERAFTVDHLVQPFYEFVLGEAVLRGYLSAPGFFEDPLARQAWCGAIWSGPTRGHLNPLQEAKAVTERLTNLTSTREQETAEYSGRDWEENLEQATLERRLTREAGLDVEPVAERIQTEPLTPVDPDQVDAPDGEEALV